MLEFSKFILANVSFDEKLFLKELRKLIQWSKNEGVKELQKWCVDTYGPKFGDKIIHVFNNVE